MAREKTQSTMQPLPIPPEKIERTTLLIRGLRAMLDTDLAELYGVSTKAFNQAIKRNRDRFPSDFMFRLTKEEKQEVVTICDHLRKLKFSPVLPAAFTEHGAIMAATVLNTERAIKVSVFVVRAFVKLREMFGTQKEFGRKLESLEKDSQSTTRNSGSYSSLSGRLCSPRSCIRSVGLGLPRPRDHNHESCG